MDHKSLRLLTFNVRSLVDLSRQIDLCNTLQRNNIDILLLFKNVILELYL